MAKRVNHSARAHSDLPPSSSDKWLKCFAWRRLMAELVSQQGEAPSSAAAEEGTEAHELMEKHLSGLTHLDVKYHGFDELMECIEWVEKQPGRMFLEERLDFGEGLGYEGLTGTGDVLLVEPHRLTLPDLKFGRGLVDHVRNPQLMIYMVGAVNRFGPRECYRLVVMQPRAYHPEGSIREYEFDHDELEAFIADELLPAIKGSYDSKSVATPGPHCHHFCDVAPRCKALRDKARNRFKESPIERIPNA